MDEEENHKSKVKLAEKRTDWALERTLMAKERTFSAWGRTGVSAMAIGIVIARILGDVESDWIATSIGVLMIVSGIAIYLIGFFSYRKALKELEQQGVRAQPIWIFAMITFALLFASVLALIFILAEKNGGL